MAKNIITVITDFGIADTCVGTMKGVILSINSSCTIVDITHEIQPQDIRGACFALEAAYRYFPKGTIHLAIVDPGVGSSRRPLLIETEDYFFIGPDNGIFTRVLTKPDRTSVIELANASYFLSEVSATFHGRDIFAPVAAHLSKGIPPSQFGNKVSDCVLLSWPEPFIQKEGEAEGQVIHIDRFGNLVTNLTRSFMEELSGGRAFHADCAGTSIAQLVPSYAYGKQGELYCVYGSSGYLEISSVNGSARDLLKARRGDCVKIIIAQS